LGLAPVLEAPQAIAEREQPLVVRIGGEHGGATWTIHIV
jgi:hypothetical protein